MSESPEEAPPVSDEEAELNELMAENYWVSKEPEDFASDAVDRFEAHYLTYQTSGVGETVARSYRMYHSMDPEGHSGDNNISAHAPGFIGEQGEFTYTEVNHYRNNILHQKALVTSEKPAFVIHASTSEADSLEQVEMAEAVLDYAMETRGVGDALDHAVETSLVESIGWVRLDWDSFNEDLDCHSLGVFDVAHQRCRRIADAEWLIARVAESKWAMVAEARGSGDIKLALEIAQFDDSQDEDERRAMPAQTADEDDEQEVVYVYHVYCRPTPQVPEGRYARVLADGTVIEDGPFRFAEIPVYPIAPNRFLGSTVSYSNSWDLMPLQSLSNATLSAMASRIDAFGVPNITYQEGTDVGVHENGLALWPVPPGAEKPAVLDFLGNFPSALPQFHGLMEQLQNKLSGVNSVVRGQPDENISSGSFAALVEAQAVKFNGPADRALTYAAEKVGMGVIRMYQAFANEEMVISITGEDDRSVVKTFTRGSLDKISRVSVQRTNPVTKTNAGRMEMANNLMAQKLIRHPTEYMTVAKTGNHRSIFADDVSLLAHIKDENTRMVNGQQVQAGQHENHLIHLQEHISKLDSRLRENNPPAAAALEAHIGMHFMQWMEISIKNPAMLVPHGIPPLPPPPQAQMMQQGMLQKAGMGGQPGGGQPAPGGDQPAAKPGPAPENKVKGSESGQRNPKLPEPAEPATPKGQ